MSAVNLFQLVTRLNTQNPYEILIRNESKNKFVYEYRYFHLEYLKYRPHENEVFAFISVRYTITNIQKP